MLPVQMMPWLPPHWPLVLTSPTDCSVQEPNAGWQPPLQYSLELPQYPCSEQQEPNFDPKQVTPLAHFPSVETLRPEGGVEEGARILEVLVVVGRREEVDTPGLLLLHVPYRLWQPDPQ